MRELDGMEWYDGYLRIRHGQGRADGRPERAVYAPSDPDATLDLRHVIAGVNMSNGYAYCVYGYRFKEGKEG